MHSRRPSRRALKKEGQGVRPPSQPCRVTGASLWKLACLSVLISALPIGVTVRAHDAAKKQAADSRPVSGFLGDYSGLVPDAKNGDLLLYEKDPNVLKKYKQVHFRPCHDLFAPRGSRQWY
jgi:hypothetical protein